jgi:Ca2+-binding EF-hand superfamily protein
MSDFPTFEDLDTDGDGVVSYAELSRFNTRQPMPYIPPQLLADADGDGTITKDEYEAFKAKWDRSQ